MWTRDKRQKKLGGTYRCVDNRQLGGKDRCVDRIHEIFKRYIQVVRQETGYSWEVKALLWTMGRFRQVFKYDSKTLGKLLGPEGFAFSNSG